MRRNRIARRLEGGFTLLELIVVVTMIGILAALALPNLAPMPRRAKEAVLKNNLATLRKVIDQYNADFGFYPATLDALVEEHYLRSIPEDPMTGKDEWELEYENPDDLEGAAETDTPDGASPGIIDVHSLSDTLAMDGSAYADW